jgi:uncharacterized membrane protein
MTVDRPGPGSTRKRERPELELEEADIRIAMMAYLPVLCLAALILRRRVAFVTFHSRQGLLLFSIEILAGMLYFIPECGFLLSVALAVFCAATALRALQKARDGEFWEAPVFGWLLSLFHP